jgi:hypothetical protein
MGWTQTLPVKGERATAEPLHNEFRHACLERAAARDQWYLPDLPQAHQKGRRLTSELTDGLNDIIGGWKWIESYADWRNFSVWSLVTTPTDPPEMEWNIFEKAIGPSITTWRDPRGKGARFNARQFEDMRELANEMTTFTLTSAGGGTQGRRRRGSAYQPTCGAALAELAGTAWQQNAYAFGIHIWHYYSGYYTHLGAQYTGQHQRASYFGFTVHPARPGCEDMTGHPCQHIYPYAKYRAYRSRYTGGSSFTMSIGREVTALMDKSETNPSPSSYEDLVAAGSPFKSGTIDSDEEQTIDRTVLFSDGATYTPGTRYLILYLDNDDPTESALCAGWSPGSGTEYSTDNFNWAAGAGVLGTFNFDKLAA